MRSFSFAFLYFITKSTHMIQLILLMFGLIFPNTQGSNHNHQTLTTVQRSIDPGEGLENGEGNGNGNGHGNGGNTGGNTGQTPP